MIKTLLKHCVSLEHYDKVLLQELIDLAIQMKANPTDYANHLKGRSLLMLFEKTSTRTRISFEQGMKQMGGESITLDWGGSNFPIASIAYETRYVSEQCDVLMARLKSHHDMLAFAEYARCSVINGCDDQYHPCQTLADLLTMYETHGSFTDLTVTYVGVYNNVVHSLVSALPKLGGKLILVTPIINPALQDHPLLNAAIQTGSVEFSTDLADAAQRSHFVYTDTWIDMELFHEPAYVEEKARRINLLQPYQLNAHNLKGSDAYILHDMPIHSGLEIAAELVEHSKSLIFTQASNRTHAQKALLSYLLDQR